MGNAAAKIGLQLDGHAYESGSVIKGKVYLSVNEKITNAQGIYLAFSGEEFAVSVRDDSSDTVSTSSRSGRGSTSSRSGHTHTACHNSRHKDRKEASNVLVNAHVLLKSFGGQGNEIPQGHYEYPFEWGLPSNLPSTMRCQRGESLCEIRYELRVHLRTGSSTSSFSLGSSSCCSHNRRSTKGRNDPNLSAGQWVRILSRGTVLSSSPLLRPFHLEPERVPVRSCCCLFNFGSWSSRGHVELGMDVPTHVVTPSGMVHVGMTGRNASSVPVQYLRACWRETVEWTAHGRNEKVSKVLAEGTILEDHLPSAWRSAAAIHQTAPQGLEQRLISHEGGNHMTVEGDREGSSHDRVTTNLLLPSDAHDSFQGCLIEVRHVLTVSAVLNQCCMRTPESSVMMHVQRTLPRATSYDDDVVVAAAAGAHSAESSSIVAPSAPSSDYDLGVPVYATAQVLPPDWTPQEAEVVVLPASAIEIATVPGTHPGNNGTYNTTDGAEFGSAPSAPSEQEAYLQSPSAPRSMRMTSSATATNRAQDILTIETLLRGSQDPLRTFRAQICNDPLLVTNVHSLTPPEFVRLIQAVPSSMAPSLAREVAETMLTHVVTSRHLMCLLWGFSDPDLRLEFIRILAPLLADGEQQTAMWGQELSSVEFQYFLSAIRQRSSPPKPAING